MQSFKPISKFAIYPIPGDRIADDDADQKGFVTQIEADAIVTTFGTISLKYFRQHCRILPRQEENSRSIAFADTWELLIAGQKTVTRRFWKEQTAKLFQRYYQQQVLIPCTDKSPRVKDSRLIGHLLLTKMPYQEKLGAMPLSDLEAEGGFAQSVPEFINHVARINDAKITADSLVWVIRFQFFPLLEECEILWKNEVYLSSIAGYRNGYPLIRVQGTDICCLGQDVNFKPRPTAICIGGGIGVSSVGLINAGFDVIASIDCDPTNTEKAQEISLRTQSVFERNIGGVTIHRTIEDLVASGDYCNLRPANLVVVTLLCDGHSLNNEQLNDIIAHQATCTFIEEQVKSGVLWGLIFENVIGYIGSQSWINTRIKLEGLGFSVEIGLLWADDFGAPQHRPRVIARCLLGGELPPVANYHAIKRQSWWDAIADLVPTFEKVVPTNKLKEVYSQKIAPFLNGEQKAFLLEATGYRNNRNEDPTSSENGPRVALMDEPVWTLKSSIFTDGNYNNRHNFLNCFVCDRAAADIDPERWWEYGNYYRLNLRAVARLMGLPDSFEIGTEPRFDGAKMAEGVPPQLIEAVAKSLLDGHREYNCASPFGETLRDLDIMPALKIIQRYHAKSRIVELGRGIYSYHLKPERALINPINRANAEKWALAQKQGDWQVKIEKAETFFNNVESQDLIIVDSSAITDYDIEGCLSRLQELINPIIVIGERSRIVNLCQTYKYHLDTDGDYVLAIRNFFQGVVNNLALGKLVSQGVGIGKALQMILDL